MATRESLKKLIAQFQTRDACLSPISLESFGAVDAMNRIERGDHCDIAVLTHEALQGLSTRGFVRGDSIIAFALSETMIAVPETSTQQPIHSREQLIEALRQASAIGYSSGASGKILPGMFEQWGVLDELKPRMVQAPSGVSIGSLLASGAVTIGFQQRSELIHCEGVRIVSSMPKGDEITVSFSAAICRAAIDVDGAKEFIRFLTAPSARDCLLEEGLDSAQTCAMS